MQEYWIIMICLLVCIVLADIIGRFIMREKHYKKLLGRDVEYIPTSEELMRLWEERHKFSIISELLFRKFFAFIARIDFSKELPALSTRKLKLLYRNGLIKPSIYFDIMKERERE